MRATGAGWFGLRAEQAVALPLTLSGGDAARRGTMLHRISLALIVGVGVAACFEEPSYRGASLFCEDGAACPDGLRCYEGRCVLNTPPQANAGDFETATIGEPSTLSATASDREGDTVNFRWRQLAGPGEPLIDAPVEGAELTVVPERLGMHTFEVVAVDGRDAGPPATVQLMVQPGEPVIYVSQLGADTEACGRFDSPCASLGAGFARLQDTGAKRVLLASATEASAYTHCLDMVAQQRLEGCFEPTTWQQVPDSRDMCRIRCAEPTGHRLRESAAVLRASLASDAGAPGDLDYAATVTLGPGSPELIQSEVVAPDCGSSCSSVGVFANDGSDAGLHQVHIGSLVSGFQPLDTYVGVYALGSTVSVGEPVAAEPAGAAHAAYASDTVISLSAPANVRAVGVLGIRSDVTLEGGRIEGGYAPELSGVSVFGGALTARAATVTLTGFGTRSMTGFTAAACTTEAGAICACQSPLETCAELPPDDEVLVAPARLSDNTLHLAASTDEPGMAPCLGIGVSLQGEKLGHSVVGNEISAGAGFNFAAGVLLDAAPAQRETKNEFENNVIAVAGTRADPLCEAYNREQSNAEASTGGFGIFVQGDRKTQLQGNTVSVGPSEVVSVGLWGQALQAPDIRENVIWAAAADAPPSFAGSWGAGAVLTAGGQSQAPAGNLVRNRIGTRGGSGTTFGMRLLDRVHWSVQNNFVYGGDGYYSTGIALENATPETLSMLHNSVHAGGLEEHTLLSRSISAQLTEDAPDVLRWTNNLLDAGGGDGRRYLVQHSENSLAELGFDDSNIGQFLGEPSGPAPTALLDVTPRTGSNLFPAPDTVPPDTWSVLYAGAGQAATLQWEESSGGLVAVQEQAINGKPKAVWRGTRSGQAYMAVVTNDSIAVARAERGRLRGFVAHPLVGYTSGQPVLHQPVDLTLAYGGEDDNRLFDIFFVAPPSEHYPGGLWQMAGRPDGGFDPPELALGTTDNVSDWDPQQLSAVAAAPDETTLWMAAGTWLIPYGSKARTADPLNLDSFERDGESITIARIDNLKFVSVGGDAAPDLVVFAEQVLTEDDTAPGRVFVWTDWRIGEGPQPMPLTAAAFDQQPCIDSRASTAAAVRSSENSSLLVLGCSDGTVQLFEYGSSEFKYIAEEREEMTAVSDIATRDFESGGPFIGDDKPAVIVASYPEAGRLVRYVLEETPSSSRYQAPSDIAVAGSTGEVETDPGDTVLAPPSAQESGVNAVCPLKAHDQAEPPWDLALTQPNNNLCIDEGTSADVTADIDGDDTRTDGAPDVGADELTQ